MLTLIFYQKVAHLEYEHQEYGRKGVFTGRGLGPILLGPLPQW